MGVSAVEDVQYQQCLKKVHGEREQNKKLHMVSILIHFYSLGSRRKTTIPAGARIHRQQH